MSIFDEILNKMLNESTEMSGAGESEEVKKTIRPIPVHPEMETEEQGVDKAFEKIAKYFYDLSSGGKMDDKKVIDDVEMPDDFLSPILKGKIDKFKDKNFEKNELMWDSEEKLDKLKKEIEYDMEGSEDDFDDFDYRDNDFGDDDADTSDLDADTDGGGGGSSSESKSEKDKLKDAIKDAIDELKSQKGEESGKDSGSQSGSESGSSSSGSTSGSESGSSSSGSTSGSESGSSSSGSTPGGESGMPSSAKDKKLEELKDALEKGDSEGFGKAMGEAKEGGDGSGALAGESRGEVSDDEFKRDMEKAGFSDKEIDDMSKLKESDTTEDFSEEELKKLKKEVVDGLESRCKKRGGSALAKTVVKQAMKATVNNEEWRKMLELFLKKKSVLSGDTAKAKTKTVYGHKNHLWRGAVLPTRTNGHGSIQKIYCFVDFSGSVNKDLVYTFLGKVIDLCEELNYTDVVVYGFGEQIVLPRKINGKMLKKDTKEVVLSQTWDYIDSQDPGPGNENFEDVAETIKEIRKTDKNSVFLIFGDALWSCYDNPHKPEYLIQVNTERIMRDICFLVYYTEVNSTFAGEIAYLKEICKAQNIITSKASHIREY